MQGRSVWSRPGRRLRSNGLCGRLMRASDAVAWVEARFAGAIVVAILVLLLANVVSRAFRSAVDLD